MSWYFAVLKKYAEFSGRARRKEYWMFALSNFIIVFVLGRCRRACRQPGRRWYALRLGCSDSRYCWYGQKVA